MIPAISPWGLGLAVAVGAAVGYSSVRLARTLPGIGPALLGAAALLVLYLVGLLAWSLLPGVFSWS